MKRKQMLSDALPEQRRWSEAAWNGAIAKMRTEWIAGRDADRRSTVVKHEPDRRWRIRVLLD
jgi:hypothetical protein